jgi:hypothetical protein
MSLNYDLRACEGLESLDDGVTNAIIWVCIPVGLGWELTEKNVDDWTHRVMVYQALIGPLLNTHEGDPFYITPEHIRAHIGMQVNTTWDTKTQWQKKVTGWADAAGDRLTHELLGVRND